ncbi:MAG: 50S ribosomal protein L24 [Magnetococcales bacterium]|nr:50S ribosomal protein L24 [Magnetococcales bacterium]
MKKQRFRTSLRKGDQVVIIAGKEKGKQGEILRVLPKKNALLVAKLNMVKRHTKPSRGNEGGIVDKEAPIHISNVMILDPDTGKGARIGKKVLEDGRKVRVACGSGEVLDS